MKKILSFFIGVIAAIGSMAQATTSDFSSGVTSEIVCFGHSQMYGTGATNVSYNSVPAYLRQFLAPRLVKNEGIGGQSMQQIAARQGGTPIKITISGNVFNGATPVNITSINIPFLSTPADNDTRYASGMVAGVHSIIRRTVVSGVETYVLWPAGSATVAVLPNSLFIPDTYFNSADAVVCMMMGRNDVTSVTYPLTNLKALTDSCFSAMKGIRRFLIMGVLVAQAENTGTANNTAILAANAALKAAYPNNYVEATPPTSWEMQLAGYTPTSDDLTDIANGVWPRGLYSDGLHFKDQGQFIQAYRYYQLIKKNNW